MNSPAGGHPSRSSPPPRSRPQVHRILVPTDLGETAEHALKAALGLARQLGADLTLFHAFDAWPPGHGPGLYIPVEDLRAVVENALTEALARTRALYPRTTSLLGEGVPWREIVAAARHTGADLIIMGTHGRTGLPRLLLGSVAEKVVRTSPVPVLTVPSPQVKGDGAPRSHAMGLYRPLVEPPGRLASSPPGLMLPFRRQVTLGRRGGRWP